MLYWLLDIALGRSFCKYRRLSSERDGDILFQEKYASEYDSTLQLLVELQGGAQSPSRPILLSIVQILSSTK